MSTEILCNSGSKLTCMGNKIVKFGSTGLFTIKKYSPEIFMVVGVGGVIAGTILACKATLKAPQIIREHQEMINAIDEAKNINSEKYGNDQARQDKALTFLNTGKSFIFLYAGSATVMTIGLSLLVGSSIILKKRNLAIGAAYALMEKSFTKYRNRVISELGEDKDFHFNYGTEYETLTEETVDETGKKKKVKKQVQVLKNGNDASMYSRIFEEQVYDTNGGYTGSSQWSPNGDYNMTNLVLKNGWANEHLRARGYLFLNDVYEELGFPRTKAGQMVGWKWQGDGDNYVSFGPEIDAVINKTPGYLAYRDGKSILLDFNVDGVILDEIE